MMIMQSEKKYTMASLCDGIGGWQLAAQRAGITPVWSSEIERFCIDLGKKNFPHTKQMGDIKAIDGKDKSLKVDIICTGTPCQSFSVQGRGEGLNGRSGLFYEATRILHEMRPRWFVWENVTGALYTNRGLEFRTCLEEIAQAFVPLPDGGKWAGAGLAELPHCEIAWRTLDAQFWGVPQERKRIYLVTDFGGRRAKEVLFDSETLQRVVREGESERIQIPETSRAPLEEAGYPITYSIIANIIGRKESNGGNGKGYKPEVSYTMTASDRPHAVARIENEEGDGYIRWQTLLEMERLQGLPDNWTLIDPSARDATARKRALGNGMAQPCADWIMKRIACIMRGGDPDEPAKL